MAMTTPWRIGLKVLLAASTLLAMLSYGGLLIFLFLPLGVGMWWAVRHSRRIERVAWVALAGLAGAEWAWQITVSGNRGRLTVCVDRRCRRRRRGCNADDARQSLRAHPRRSSAVESRVELNPDNLSIGGFCST